MKKKLKIGDIRIANLALTHIAWKDGLKLN